MELPCSWWCEEWIKVPWQGMPFSFSSTVSGLQVYSVFVLRNLIQVTMIGINFEDNHIATVGNNRARPILRE